MALIKKDDAKTISDVVFRNVGVKSLEELNGKDNYRIDHLEEAADLIKSAIKDKQQITIVGDYDADGVTSSAIMYYVLANLGANVKVRIPKRLSEGYGISTKIIDEIDSGLIVTVDNGIVAFDPIKKAKEKGLKVIITDHHLLDESGQVPEADIIIDPHIEGSADFEDYCGAGIAYRLVKHLTDDKQMLAKMSCFAAIGTVADVMPLIEENRQIVQEGLKNMVTYGARTTGLYSILHAVNKENSITATDIAFKIGPMLNACGRLFDDGAMISFNAICYDGKYDETIGMKMNGYNEQRKKLVKQGEEAAEQNIKDNGLFADVPLVIYEPSIQEGIVGIIAGHLAEKYQVPTFVFTDSEQENVLKGSGRSAGEVHLKDLLDKSNEMLYKYGGHKEAAGVSVFKENYEKMVEKMQEVCPEPQNLYSIDDIYYDLEVKQSEIPVVLNELKKFEPFGEGNPKPVFLVKGFQLSPRYSSVFRTMGENNEHLKLFGASATAVAFNQVDEYHRLSDPQRLNFVGVITENNYMGNSEAQIEVSYMECAEEIFEKSLLAMQLEKMAQSRY